MTPPHPSPPDTPQTVHAKHLILGNTQMKKTTPESPILEAPAQPEWSYKKSQALYRTDRWGGGYFSVAPSGNLQVHPNATTEHSIDLKQLVDDLRARDLEPPLLIRFTDILRHRLGQLATAFANAIKENDYRGVYRGVYPIKVNQQRQVVEEVLDIGGDHGFGIEAGSKPELLAIMAMVENPDTPIICNGFKDDQFIEAVILAKKLGRNVIPVVEKFSELKLIAKYAKLHSVEPSIGIRVKLATRGAGRWESSGGVRSKFGLFISEVLDAIEFLREEGMLGCLNLLHFHLGSQINDIRQVKRALTELVRVYTELYKAGAGLTYIDIGGGLGVDYDGSKTTADSSINYSLQEYANDVVHHIREVCDDQEVPHPTIISESGRSMVAHHSVLIFDVLGWSGFDRFELPEAFTDADLEEFPAPVRTLAESWVYLSDANCIEYYHDAMLARDQTFNLFSLGYCSLEHRGLAERLFYAICSKTWRFVRQREIIPEEFHDLEPMLSDTYFCNCSIFQSLPDAWAIDQLFPIMPIHRLNEEPTCKGILADITCDSDGKIDHFIGSEGSEQVLPLHPFTGGDYFLGAFLVGAYQETLGDLHNLFGDTNAVHIRVDEHGRPHVEEVVEGDTIAEVLGYVQFEPEQLRRTFRKTLERAVGDGRLTIEESRLLRRFYENGLAGYTYLT